MTTQKSLDATKISSNAANLFLILVSVNTALLVASNAAGAKMIALPFGLAASATVFPYALSFLMTDLISELFGEKAGRKSVMIGFAGLVLSVMFFRIAIWAPPADGWGGQEAYVETLGLGLRLLAGGWLSYMVSQHLDVWLFHRIRKATSGKHLWLRNNGSTLFSQLVDTVIFITVAFYGVFPILPAIIGQYLVKLAIAFADTALMYPLTAAARNYIGADGDND